MPYFQIIIVPYLITDQIKSQHNLIYKNNKKYKIMFIELKDQIPYAKINKLSVTNLSYSNDAFEIKLDRKCENLPEQRYSIIRKLPDFRWVKEKLQKQSPWVLILPEIAEPNWSLTDLIRINDQQKSKLKAWYNSQYLQKVMQRFMKLIEQIILPNVYKSPGFIRTSLYTFLDKSYQLYRTQKYQQSSTKQSGPAPSESTLVSIAHTIGKGSMKILGMFNLARLEQTHKFLSKQISQMSQITAEITFFLKELEGLKESYQTLRTNFFNQQKQIKEKETIVFQITLKASDLLRLATLILTEMKNVQKKYEELESKMDEKNLKDQLNQYQKFILKEIQSIHKEWQNILEEMYQKIYNNEVQMKLANAYMTKL